MVNSINGISIASSLVPLIPWVFPWVLPRWLLCVMVMLLRMLCLLK
jgi:hypothetical protein